MKVVVGTVAIILAACSSSLSVEPGLPSETIPPPVLWYESAVASPPDGAVVVDPDLEIESSPFLELGFGGDTSFTHGLAARDPLREVLPLLRVPDLTLVNLETAVAEPSFGSARDKEFTFRSPPQSVDVLREGGIDGVALANNHALDFGREALGRTLELLDAGGVGRAGAGGNAAEAYAPMVFVREGTRVAVLSFSRILPGTWAALSDRAGVASGHAIDKTVKAIEDSSQVADVVVVMVHWGLELAACPLRYQRELGQTWIEAGADLVVGSHPHVLQGVERVGESWIVHSTGNFAFPSANRESADTALFRFTFHDDTVSLTVDPLRIVSGRPQPATEVAAARILDQLSRRSFGFEFTADGSAVTNPNAGRC
ncbi:MAG: CapA family protein [Acidimicrobiia bacterium]